jgi:hypothetical protein
MARISLWYYPNNSNELGVNTNSMKNDTVALLDDSSDTIADANV